MFEVTLHRLRVFKSVVESGSFNLASNYLGISQSAISAHIQALEREVGLALFIRRSGKQPMLTEAGKILYSYTSDVISRTDKLERDLNILLHNNNENRLTLSIQRSLANTLFSPYISEFRRKNPQIELIVYTQTQSQVLEALSAENSDLGIMFSLDAIPGFYSEILSYQRLVFVVSKDHELAKRTYVSPSDLEAYDFIDAIQTSSYAKMINAAFQRLNIKRRRVILQLEDDQTIIEVVKKGIGVASLALCCVERELERGTLVEVPLRCNPLQLQVRLIYSEHRLMSRAAKRFRAYILRELSETK